MHTVTFDTLKFANTLKNAGVDIRQAEAQAQALSEALGSGIDRLATKNDLELLRSAVRADMNNLQVATKADMASLRADFDSLRMETKADSASLKADIECFKVSTDKKFVDLELRMTLKFGAMLAVAVSVLIAVLKVSK
jgi:hypothetical protein